MTPTRYPGLYYSKFEGQWIRYETRNGLPKLVSSKDTHWQFVVDEVGVGPLYKTKADLLSDMDRYAKENWGFKNDN